MLKDPPSLPVNLKNSGYHASADIRYNSKLLRSDPDGDSLKILLFRSLGVFEYIRELFDKKHVINNQSIIPVY